MELYNISVRLNLLIQRNLIHFNDLKEKIQAIIDEVPLILHISGKFVTVRFHVVAAPIVSKQCSYLPFLLLTLFDIENLKTAHIQECCSCTLICEMLHDAVCYRFLLKDQCDCCDYKNNF